MVDEILTNLQDPPKVMYNEATSALETVGRCVELLLHLVLEVILYT